MKDSGHPSPWRNQTQEEILNPQTINKVLNDSFYPNIFPKMTIVNTVKFSFMDRKHYFSSISYYRE